MTAVVALLVAAATSGMVMALAMSTHARPSLPAPAAGSAEGRTHPRIPLRGGAATGALLFLFLPEPAPFLVPLVGLAAWRLPVFAEAHAARRRRARADAELPQLLDLLAAASSAGLNAALALRRAAGALEGPLAEELRGVTQAVDLGGRWRDELRATADRLDLPDLRRAVAALARTDTLGSSLTTSMHELADRVRTSRRAAVTERARTAPVKMLFPLVFLVLPAFLLLTVVPVLLATLQSIK